MFVLRRSSNRMQVKLIRIARTISGLEGRSDISIEALEEAVECKQMPTGLQVVGGEGVIQT